MRPFSIGIGLYRYPPSKGNGGGELPEPPPGTAYVISTSGAYVISMGGARATPAVVLARIDNG